MIGTTISHYKILEKLGEGGMGVVYKAEDTKLKRTVALKFFTPQMLGTEEDKTRFILEAQAAAALDHPNICTIYEIDEAEEQTFIAMAYVDGQSLEEKAESGVLDMGKALDIVIQVAEGLNEAHSKGIIHRDIKAANIMVTDDGKAKIMDFGLAKLTGRTRLTKTSTIMGTVAYMSPEQASGEETIDHRTDIWSLGVVLYKMLTGNPPFDAPSDPAVIHKILYEEPKPISSLRGDVPSTLEDAIEKMLQKNPQDRYEDTATLISDLKSIGSRMATVTARKTPSIAVLPFINMSADPEQDYFCDGLAEELINALTQIKDLHVVARTSAFFFKDKDVKIRDIGKELNVETVLEGSVRKAGNRLRITGQLVNVADGYHLWSERYDRESDDIFAIQDEITLAIVDKLKPKLVAGEKDRLVKRQTVDLEAYNLYLRGLYFIYKQTEEGLKKGIGYFEQAIDKQPDYALAYAGLADCYATSPFALNLPPKEVFPKAKDAAVKALAIDETLAEAHTSLGFVNTMYDWDWEGAEKRFLRAIQLNPGYALVHHWYAIFLAFVRGRFDEAVREATQALELDPFSLVFNRDVATVFFCARQYDRAMEAAKKTIEMDAKFSRVHLLLGSIYLGRSMFEEAVDEFKKEMEALESSDPVVECVTAAVHAFTGESSKAKEVSERLMERSRREYVSPSWLAALHFALGEIDKGFKWLDRACEEREGWFLFLNSGPIFEMLGLRSDPRYIAMLKKINLEP